MPPKLSLGEPVKPKQTAQQQRAQAQAAREAADALVQSYERLQHERRTGYGYRVPRGLEPLFESWELERRFPARPGAHGPGPMMDYPVVPMEHFVVYQYVPHAGPGIRSKTKSRVTSKAIAAVRARETNVGRRVQAEKSGSVSRKRARIKEEDEKIEKRNAQNPGPKPPKGRGKGK